MNPATAEELLRIAHQYYPVDSSLGAGAQRGDPDFHLHTPEFQRWQVLWDQAVKETKPWEPLLHGLRGELPSHHFGTYTPAYMAGGYVLLTSWRMPLLDGPGGQRLIRVAGAISLLAPLYFIYGTVERITPDPLDDASHPRGRKWVRRDDEWVRKADKPPSQPELFLQPTGEMQPSAEAMSRCIERTLGYRRFPLELAEVPIPDIRVHYLHGQTPTLLTALFLDRLEYLP